MFIVVTCIAAEVPRLRARREQAAICRKDIVVCDQALDKASKPIPSTRFFHTRYGPRPSHRMSVT